MIYPYECSSCGYQFEVIKSVRQIDDKEDCPVCCKLDPASTPECRRCIGRTTLMAVNDWTESWNPAFGKIVKNKAHQREILAELKDQGKNFVEIGNEPVDNLHKTFDSAREKKQADRWKINHEELLYEAKK